MFLRGIHVQGYKSIQHEAVAFSNPLFLVGKNGSGKTNFVDVFAFVSECMRSSLTNALNRRGGLPSLLSRDYDPNPYKSVFSSLTIRLDFSQSKERAASSYGYYAFSVGRDISMGIRVAREKCQIDGVAWFDRNGEQFSSSLSGVQPSVNPTALLLPLLGGVLEFASLYEFLADIRVYAIVPSHMKGPQDRDGSTILKEDGSNAANVLLHLQNSHPDLVTRISELMQPVVPGIARIEPTLLGNKVDLLFLGDLLGQIDAETLPMFGSSEMSDGTLRVLAIIIAALQQPSASLLALEEPELSIHPGALGAVADAIDFASRHSQVIVTTHSPELLDSKWIQSENLRIVEWDRGATHIVPIGASPVKMLQRHLAGAGELLRSNALDAAPYSTQASPDLFESLAA